MFTAFYIIINFLSYLLPVWLAYFITKLVVAAVYFIFYRRGRRNVSRNLEYVFGNRLKMWQKEKIIFKTFQSFALFIYEFLIIRKINQRTFKDFVNPIGFENVEITKKIVITVVPDYPKQFITIGIIITSPLLAAVALIKVFSNLLSSSKGRGLSPKERGLSPKEKGRKKLSDIKR